MRSVLGGGGMGGVRKGSGSERERGRYKFHTSASKGLGGT